LKTLFEYDNPATENYVKGFATSNGLDAKLKFWLPLVAVYTGGSIAEICQLELSDIYLHKAFDGSEHWVFDINPEGDAGNDEKRLKNTTSRPRLIPIHQTLINLGLIGYAEEMKKQGNTKLFPSAMREKGVGSFIDETCWFAKYSDRAGVTDKDVTFHSFRHTFCGYLAKRHADEALLSAISGHAYKSLAKTTYNKSGKRGADIGPLVPVINAIDYGLIHQPFKQI
jgi:integrase